MKKFITLAILTVLLLNIGSVFAYEVDLSSVFTANIDLEEQTEYLKDECIFTGVDYLKKTLLVGNIVSHYFKSQDGINWEFIMEYNSRTDWDVLSPMEQNASTVMRGVLANNGQIINTGSHYIMRRRDSDWGINRTKATGKLGVYDMELNPVHVAEFSTPIVQMSYIDETCYILLYPTGDDKPYILMKSTDYINWEKIDENQGVPLRLGGNTITRTFERQGTGIDGSFVAKQNPILFVNGEPAQNIDLEAMDLFTLEVVGDFFIATSKGVSPPFLYYSKDGIYWAKQSLIDRAIIYGTPYKIQNDKLYIPMVSDPNRGYRIFNVADLEATVPQSDIYVQIGDEILGFDTPPIIEDGRTLVPMRFLFEKLNSEVSWEQETKTATVTAQDIGTIAFSIDDKSAKVNNTEKTMDVPARLINSKTMVPLRFLSEELGYTVDWNEETRTAIVSK